MTAREPVTRRDHALAALLALLAFALYRHSEPGQVNLDGLGYVKLLPHNFSAGHLLYMPLLRAATALCRGDGLRAGHLVSAVAGALSVAVAFGCARALLDRRSAAVAAVGLAVSYGVWAQGADVEAYACALAALLVLFALALAYRAGPTAPAAFCVGLALAGAALLHVAHVVITPFVAVWVIAHAPTRRRGLLDAALSVGTGGALSLGAYAYAALHVRRLDLAGAVRWFRTAGHGFRYDGTILQRLSDAVYGLAKSFVWSPYLYESNAQTLLSQFLLGLTAVAVVIGLIVARRRHLAALPLAPLLVWVAAYTITALNFFASDHERWVFILPVLWLLGAAAIASLGPRAPLVGAALAGYLAVANLATAVEPARHECWDKTRADAAAAHMADGDLVVFPGHGWDEYIGFYTRTRVVPFPVAYYAALLGRDGCAARLEKEVRLARKRGARIFAVRLFDDDDDRRGWLEMELLGIRRPEVKALVANFHPARLATVEPKVTVWRLDDP